jgi:hypothetical protein
VPLTEEVDVLYGEHEVPGFRSGYLVCLPVAGDLQNMFTFWGKMRAIINYRVTFCSV